MEPRLEPIAAPKGPPIARPMPPAAAVATPETVPVTAFAFVDQEDIPKVPAWAIKVILKENFIYEDT